MHIPARKNNLKKDGLETENKRSEKDMFDDNTGEFNLRYILILVKK